jgi:SAM-dependent methyltransferase
VADWYDTPHYYDIIFDQDTSEEADFLEAMMRRHGRVRHRKNVSDSGGGQRDAEEHGTSREQKAWRILEPACGSGRLATELAGRGHQVAGFDLNPHMLRHARLKMEKAGHQAILWEDRMESFRLPSSQRFDLAHCLVSTFKYVLDEAGAIAHLEKTSRALRSGGIYVLGLHLTDYSEGQAAHERWVGRSQGTQVICNTHTWPPDRRRRLEDVRTRLRITRRGQSKTQETLWQFRTYDAAQVRSLLAAVPSLECVACHDFNHDAEQTRSLDDSYSDLVLILRRR